MLKGDTPAKNKINKEAFEKLCGMWCTLVEISNFFGVSEDTIESWCIDTYGETFSDTYKKKNSAGCTSLRRWQLESAKKGNVTMQIWLGKQYLGQRENVEIVNDKELTKLDELLEEIRKDANK